MKRIERLGMRRRRHIRIVDVESIWKHCLRVKNVRRYLLMYAPIPPVKESIPVSNPCMVLG
jgi:hypothetical protein